MKRLENKVAIVTGAGKGLGRAFCVKLAQEGAHIVAVTRSDMEGLENTAKEVRALGRDALIRQVDVASESDTLRMADEALKTFGRIDVLVNNAAYYFGVTRKAFTEISVEEWDRMMAVNVRGPWLCARAVFPAMKAQGKGKIVNLASEVFFTGSHGFVHYVSSKGGVIGLTRALAVELGPVGICVNAVAPGYTDTEASRTIADVTKYDTSRTPLRRLEKPEDVVGAVAFLASDESDFITGQTVLVDGGRAMH
jgi:3-oxoacyl-[acyl-carrier protein] reductase|uniref:3-oxoacyl-ACP reductase FabG n=1 Tax=Desulfomonile tiedjei TaxID=2358 RepID=A0A7C4AS35_9BACT